MRLIISGSPDLPLRDANGEGSYQKVKAFIAAAGFTPTEIITVAGRVGADAIGRRIALTMGVPNKEFTRKREAFGDGADHMCFGDMVVYANAMVVIKNGECKASETLVSIAETYGIKVKVLDASTGLADPMAILPLRDVTPPEPYIFPQSHSSLGVFETCPRQYEAKYITKEVVFVQNPAAAWGDQVHNALEAYVKANGVYTLPDNMAMYKPFADWVLTRAAKRNGIVMAERMSAVNRSKTPVEYRSKQRWIGGKIDITIRYPDEGKAEVYDWKTGKVKNDQTQLQLYGALALADYADVEEVKAGYIWLAHNQISPPVLYTRDDYAKHWDTFEHKYLQLQDAYRRGVFPPKPGGLCAKWCEVTRCEFHGRGR